MTEIIVCRSPIRFMIYTFALWIDHHLNISNHMTISIYVAVMRIIMMPSCPYFIFIDASTSEHKDIFIVIGFSLEDKQGLSLGGVDTSILHHAFISIFIALWTVVTLYISILMAILSYFTRFIMKRGNTGNWNSGWKMSKHWKPILHCSKNLETPWNIFLELIRIIGRKKYTRGPTHCPRDRGRPPIGRAPISWAPWWASGVHLLLY